MFPFSIDVKGKEREENFFGNYIKERRPRCSVISKPNTLHKGGIFMFAINYKGGDC